MSYPLSGLYRYPVKSLSGETLSSMSFDVIGPRYDRRFMLADADGKFITQRTYPAMAKLTAQMQSDESLIIHHPQIGPLEFSIAEFVKPQNVTVWNDSFEAHVTRSEQLAVLSGFLGLEVQLIWMADQVFRQVDRDFFDAPRQVSFADGFPVLLTNTVSLEDLNERLEEPVPMSRFRPNIVVDAAQAFEEDTWKEVQIGEVKFAVVKPCSRCVMTTLDDEGKTSKEPLKTLATYRRNEFGVCFGQNLVPLNEGQIDLGEPLKVLR